MKIILRQGDSLILRFDRGEEVIEELHNYCRDNNIKAGFISAIGAVSEVELKYYDITEKKYQAKFLKNNLELVSLLGNMSMHENEVVVHVHGVFSDKEMNTKAGHVTRMVVAATCEMELRSIKGKISREHSEEIGLKLMK